VARLGGASRPAATPGPVPRVRIALVLAVGGTASLLLSIRQTATDLTRPPHISPRYPAPGTGRRCPPRDRPAVTCLPETVRSALTWAGFAGIGITSVAYDRTAPLPGSAAMLPVLAT